MKTLGVIYGFKKGKWIKHSTDDLIGRLTTSFASHDVRIVKVGLLDSRVEIRGGKLIVRDAKTKQSYRDLDGVYIANWRKAPEIALALAKYMQLKKKAILNNEILHYPAVTKLGEMVLMANQSIPMPNSFFVRDKYIRSMVENELLPAGFGFPLIVKSTTGSMGVDNWLVQNFTQLGDIARQKHESMLVVQEFIPNDFDYRVLVFGNKVRAVIKRSRKDKDATHLNNTSAGADGRMIKLEDFPRELEAIALKAASATRRSDLAGVDIIIDSITGKPYVLEVNKSPQIETGSNIDTKTRIFTEYTMEKLHG